MRALTVTDGSGVALEEIAEPRSTGDDLLVQSVAVGICGTDRRIVARALSSRLGHRSLVLGHESLGRVLEAPGWSGFSRGDLVVGTVRRPLENPCRFCARGEPDLCEDGRYSERGISSDGFASERYALEPQYAVAVDPALGLAGVLLEPASVVAKAWEQLDRVARASWGTALVLGAGPIGLLAALFASQRGYEVHVVDQIRNGPKRECAQSIGAVYHTSTSSLEGRFDVVVECSGALTSEAVRRSAPAGASCLLSGDEDRSMPALSARELVHELISHSRTVIGIVNSGRRHFEAAHEALRAADSSWLESLLRPRVPLETWQRALGFTPDHVKAVVQFSEISRPSA